MIEHIPYRTVIDKDIYVFVPTATHQRNVLLLCVPHRRVHVTAI